MGRGKSSAPEAAPSYLSIRTKPLLLEPRFSASAPLRSLLHAAWWARPLSPRPDLRRLRRAPGRGWFVHVFCVFVVLCKALWCLFNTLGGLGAPLWHLGLSFLHTWGMVGSLLGTLGGPWDFISAPLGSMWVPWGSMLVSCGHFGVWPWTPLATFVEEVPKMHPKSSDWGARRVAF